MLSNVATSMRIAVWLAQLLWVGLVLLMWWNFVPSSAAQQTTVAAQSCALLLVGLVVATSTTKVLREVEDAYKRVGSKR